MDLSVTRTILIRMVAVLLLLTAAAEIYACDVSDICYSVPAGQSSQQSNDCDQPTGDNCLCCCHHVIPAAAFVLQPAEWVVEKSVLPLIPQELSDSAPIDHPPQL